MNRTLLIVCSLLPLLSGCTWGLKHPNMRIPSSLSLSDVTAEIEEIEGEFHRFEKTVSIGRFPAGIAIVRLTKLMDEDTASQRLTISPFRGFEVPYWTGLFDGTPEVRSLFPIHEKSVRDKYVTLPELKEAAHVLNAGLMLVYGYDNTGTEDVCRVFGLLYEMPSGNLVAGITHSATIEDARAAMQDLPSREKPVTSKDWTFYVDHVAFRGFEKNFKKCIWDLIDRDKDTLELKPNPFENYTPLFPPFWPLNR